jgi:hypothetical protein
MRRERLPSEDEIFEVSRRRVAVSLRERLLLGREGRVRRSIRLGEAEVVEVGPLRGCAGGPVEIGGSRVRGLVGLVAGLLIVLLVVVSLLFLLMREGRNLERWNVEWKKAGWWYWRSGVGRAVRVDGSEDGGDVERWCGVFGKERASGGVVLRRWRLERVVGRSGVVWVDWGVGGSTRRMIAERGWVGWLLIGSLRLQGQKRGRKDQRRKGSPISVDNEEKGEGRTCCCCLRSNSSKYAGWCGSSSTGTGGAWRLDDDCSSLWSWLMATSGAFPSSHLSPLPE